MRRRLVILTEIISPYRIPLFNALARESSIDLHVIFLAETDPGLRQWQIYREEIRFSFDVLRSWRRRVGNCNLLLNFGLAGALNDTEPDLVLCGGYNYLASWQALSWARTRGLPFLLWSESNLQDIRRGRALVELLKQEFLRQCTAFVVPGQSAREYLRSPQVGSRRIDEAHIFIAPNAVDNDLFRSAALTSRQDAASRRAALALPDRYFLFAGRLVAEKGVFDLLSAYAKLDERVRRQIGLIFTGDGASRAELERQAASISPGMIRFAGFVQRDQLAAYYALAEMLILPTYSDPWGLVVNEAMACSLPVIVSDVAGCAADLVMDGWNGLRVRPGDVASIAAAMAKIAGNPELRTRMSGNSAERISHYSPAEWVRGIVNAVNNSGATA